MFGAFGQGFATGHISGVLDGCVWTVFLNKIAKNRCWDVKIVERGSKKYDERVVKKLICVMLYFSRSLIHSV